MRRQAQEVERDAVLLAKATAKPSEALVETVDDATGALAKESIQRLLKAQRKWIAQVVPMVDRLMKIAEDENSTEEEFAAALKSAGEDIPGLFDKLDHDALGEVMEGTMLAAMLNGALNRKQAFDDYLASRKRR